MGNKCCCGNRWELSEQEIQLQQSEMKNWTVQTHKMIQLQQDQYKLKTLNQEGNVDYDQALHHLKEDFIKQLENISPKDYNSQLEDIESKINKIKFEGESTQLSLEEEQKSLESVKKERDVY